MSLIEEDIFPLEVEMDVGGLAGRSPTFFGFLLRKSLFGLEICGFGGKGFLFILSFRGGGWVG